MSSTLKEIRDHIQSIKKTQQFTKAMKIVSAAKLRKNLPIILKYRHYQKKLLSMLEHVLFDIDKEGSGFFNKVTHPKYACQIIITSDRGLCGTFNSQILKTAEANISSRYTHLVASGELTIICIGEKGYKYFTKQYPKYSKIEDHSELLRDLGHELWNQFSQKLIDDFKQKKLDCIDITFAHFESAGRQNIKTVQWLPRPLKSPSVSHHYFFEPNSKELLKHLIPDVLNARFYTILFENIMSEHTARMNAMTKATKNAGDLVTELQLTYNKARQNAITMELIDIVNAAEALREK